MALNTTRRGQDEELAAPAPLFYLLLTEAQVTAVSFGRVPALVQEMAKTLIDWTYEDLRTNAAKPVRIARGRRRA